MSLPLRCRTTSVVRLSGLTLLTPSTVLPSAFFTRNLKFLYGSTRCALTVNPFAMVASSDYTSGICWILITTNSAGLRGANPTSMFTIPRLRSLAVVVSPSHLT